jgi:hypothetical protein
MDAASGNQDNILYILKTKENKCHIIPLAASLIIKLL